MADSPTAKTLTQPTASFARRYGLAFASVAGALLLDLLFRHFNLPHPFAAFALSAIAITFWYGGTMPGIAAVLLASLIRGFIVEGETSSLSRVLYELVFLTFAVLMIWVRRSKEALEVAIADRTAKLTTAHEDLLRRKEQLDGLFELSPDSVILTDYDFHVLRVNKEFTRMFGYTAEEIVGRWLPELIVPEELGPDAFNYRDRLSSGNRVELETIRQRKDGVRFDVSVVAKGISLGFDHGAVYLIYRDITERKKVERDLRRSEANLLEGQRLVHMCNWAYDPLSGMVTFSPEAKRIFDIESDQDKWPGGFFLERFHPEDRPVQEENFRRAQLDKTALEASFRIVLPDGSIKHIYSVAHPVLNQSGELVEFFGIGMDVTEQWKARSELEKAFEEIKQRTEAARRSENELRDVVNTVPAHVWRTTAEGQVDFVNDRWLQFTGLVFEEAFGWNWEAVVHPDDRTRVLADWHTALKNGQAMETEARVRRADGEYCWWFIRNVPLRDETGKLIKWYGTAIDIEDRKRAEQALRKSEERWRSVFENSAIGVALTDLDGRFLATNHVYQAMVGYTEEELRALCFLDVTHEDYRQANWALIAELLEGKRPQFQIEKKYRRKDGSSIWVRNNVSLVPGTERVPRFIMALSEDITQRKRAEEALRRSEAYLAEGQRLAKTGSWAVDPKTEKCIYWSEEMRQIFGLDPQRSNLPDREELLRLVHPEDRDRFIEQVDHALRAKADLVQDYRIVLPDGTVKHIHAIGHLVLDETGNIIECVGTDMDVTERKRAEEALQQSEANLAEAQRMTHTGSWAYNPAKHKTVYWSAEMFRICGFDPQQGLPAGDGFLERVPPEDRERVHEAFYSAMREKREYEDEHRIILLNGTIKHIHSIGHPVLNRSGEVVEFVGSAADVTERKRTEEALQRSETYLAEAQRLTHTGSWAYKPGGREVYWSEENFRIWGFDPQQGTPDLETIQQRVHAEDRDRVRDNKAEVVQAGRHYSYEFRIVLPGGIVKHIQTLGHPVFNASGDLLEMVGTHVDVTERKRAEEERERLRQLETDLAHMNRVTMLGELASSLAHELNQPIAASITSANACLRWLAHNPPDLERARAAALRIAKDGSRAAEIIQRLRAFYKTGAPPQRELVDLNEVAGEMLALLRNEATRHSISLLTELAPQLPRITADRVQLQQVLMNLMLNGIEAITDRAGKLTIRSQSTEDGFLLMSVSDTGVGLPSETPDQIFNAFYTTKPQGTGMGLAISRSIIEAHGGRLWATANAERGATFHFTLPAEVQQ